MRRPAREGRTALFPGVSFVACGAVCYLRGINYKTPMDINEILYSLGGLLSGGVLSGILTWRATVKEAEANAMAKVQEVYRNLTEDLVKEIDRLKTEVELLRQEVGTLSQRAGMACFRSYCVSRLFENIETNLYQIESNDDNDDTDEGSGTHPLHPLDDDVRMQEP